MLANENMRSTGADDDMMVLYFENSARMRGNPTVIWVKFFSSSDSCDPKKAYTNALVCFRVAFVDEMMLELFFSESKY